MVTLVAYFGQHSGVSVAELEPRLTIRWNVTRGWVRRRLGRTEVITASVGTAWDISTASSASASVWSPIQPGDDTETRVAKLARNLDELRTNVEDMRQHDLQRAREVADGLDKRVTEL